MTSDPLSLLRAGLDEDERIARASGGDEWIDDDRFNRVEVTEGYIETSHHGPHIARQDPKATLDRVEAIRKVIAEREAEHTRVQVSDPVVRAYGDGYRAAYDRIAGILASIYAPEPTDETEKP